MDTKNVKNVQAKVQGALKDAASAAKTAKMPKASKRLNKAANVLGVVFVLLPVVIFIGALVVEFFVKQAKKNQKGLRMPNGEGWLTSIEIEGVKFEGDELLECANEGARARVRKAKEEKEAEFDRRVATAVKKATQGQARM